MTADLDTHSTDYEVDFDNLKIDSVERTRIMVQKPLSMLQTLPKLRLLRPFRHLIDHCGGKKVRTRLIIALNHWLQVDDEIVDDIISTTEMAHNASLLVDDIQDFSDLRRGLPAAHMIYGIPTTLHCAFYVCMLTAIELNKKKEEKRKNSEDNAKKIDDKMTNRETDALKIMMENVLPLCIGQGLDIVWRQVQICPTVKEYLGMIEMKTTGLFLLALKSMEEASERKDIELEKLIKLIGMYFQIRDDYANLKFDEYIKTKGFGEDLTEGKYSYLIVHAINANPNDKTIQNILSMRTRDVNLKKIVIQIMEKLGTFKHTENLLRNLRQQINEELAKLDQNESMMKLLDALFIVEAKK